MKIRRTALTALACAAVAALLTTGCGADGGSGGTDGSAGAAGKDRVDVITTLYPLQFVTQEIGGPRVKVTNLTKAGAEPHDLELTPRQVASLSKADLVVYLKGLQPAVDEALKVNPARRAVETGSLVPPLDHGAEAQGDHSGESATEHEEHADEGRDRDDGGHEGHDHGDLDGDPHVWLDPTRLATIASGLGDNLAQADPGHAPEYRDRVAALTARLTQLDDEFRTGLANCARRDFVTTHAAFGHLAERYGLNQIAVNGISPEAEPSPSRVAQVQRTIRDKGVTTIYFETLASPRTARAIAQDLNLSTAVLDPLEGLKADQAGDYFSVMRANLEALRKGLGCS